ncbi:hypothetical protein JW992_11170 [candidate division KSB1 bacterium]|nr:hypothetical protein [candidate division KSB1 bacterium]
MQFLDGKLTELTERLDSAMLLLQAKIEKSENERQRCNESLQKELKEQIAELIVCKTDRQQLSQALRHLAEHIETDSAR